MSKQSYHVIPAPRNPGDGACLPPLLQIHQLEFGGVVGADLELDSEEAALEAADQVRLAGEVRAAVNLDDMTVRPRPELAEASLMERGFFHVDSLSRC